MSGGEPAAAGVAEDSRQYGLQVRCLAGCGEFAEDAHDQAALTAEQAASLARAHVTATGHPVEAESRQITRYAPASPADAPPPALTRREMEVAALVAQGLSNKVIATQLFVSKRTVDVHLTHIFEKLGIKSRVLLTTWYQRTGQSQAAQFQPEPPPAARSRTPRRAPAGRAWRGLA